jgi:hypothetical protein
MPQICASRSCGAGTKSMHCHTGQVPFVMVMTDRGEEM